MLCRNVLPSSSHSFKSCNVAFVCTSGVHDGNLTIPKIFSTLKLVIITASLETLDLDCVHRLYFPECFHLSEQLKAACTCINVSSVARVCII